eukprot:TRINITY_DN21445_c0_g1_i1.p1 TRINITY_DN21445_c0_g1~~TRINITY_DN21445_c0_g1_i1.p1  ORF type:complete len:326 (+),score=44.23 TRINITY_DN21445_c0_g1_i1:124-1101(+)
MRRGHYDPSISRRVMSSRSLLQVPLSARQMSMVAPSDLSARLEAVQKQIAALYSLNKRCNTNFSNLSKVILYAKDQGVLVADEFKELMQLNQRANAAKHHDLGCPSGKSETSQEYVLDSADLGIVAVLESEHPNTLRVREIFLLGLALDPEKEQMGAGVKKEINRRLYALEKRGHVAKETPNSDKWKFVAKISAANMRQGADNAPPASSVFPSNFGSMSSDVKNGCGSNAKSSSASASNAIPEHVGRVQVGQGLRPCEGDAFSEEAVLRAMESTREPLAIDEVALVCLGVENPKLFKKDLSKLLTRLRDDGKLSEKSGRWMPKVD